jgi:glycine betaine/proline transport system permease protein
MMTTLAPPLAQEKTKSSTGQYYGVGLVIFVVVVLLLTRAPELWQRFPEEWNLRLREPIDQMERWVIGNRATHPLFLLLLNPLRTGIDLMLRWVENVLLALPWPLLTIVVALIAYRAIGWGGMLLGIVSLLFMGAVGLWTESMQTLALMGVSVSLAVAVGVPLGILSARYPKFDAIMRPALDAMQTMPAFVYLIPVLLFFGVARVPSVVATVLYALPPMVRLTNLGIRQVPDEAIEAADLFGSSAWQKLWKVQLPMALPTILAGVNQTIMMALGMVVIAALIGAGGLGREVLLALQRLRVGQALEAGLAIVFMAVLLDRISHGLGRKERMQVVQRPTDAVQGARQQQRLTFFWGAVLLSMVVLALVHGYLYDLRHFPAAMQFSMRGPVDSAVRWLRDNLYQIGSLPIGTGPFSDFLIIWMLNPLRSLLQNILPWPAVLAALALIAFYSAGWRLALFSAAALFATGLLGLWHETMDTLSQVLVAVGASVVIGLPVGIASATNDRLQAGLRPVLDFLQTIPVFVYLVPVIMLFNVGRVPGLIASVLYAVAPMIRLTDMGIRGVSKEVVEAADAFGSTYGQKLLKVQLPLALPAVMLGVNQAVMMVLAMVIIAGLVGGGALGFEAVNGLAKSEVGRGMEAGLAIVLMAVILDRITQAWAQPRR